ncbi:MAG: peptidoglycan-associated lipoprotein Pal [Endomicrobiaceae bacterium]|jgi:peptidoglycan-associated lipoprotein|nr:peptidoglycan-associated lipoprotein Pal [Endomicrobiaceae bacterium]
MKRYLVFGLLSMFLVISACAKKQTVAPEETEAGTEQGTAVNANIDSPEFAQEPSIREGSLDSKSALSTIYFTLDSSNVSAEALDTLKANSNFLKNNPKVNIVIEGHCDERGTTEYNLALGQRRAVKVKEYYVQLGIAPNRIATVSYGEEMPADKRNNEAGWAKNRRAETKVIVNK